MEDNIAIEKTPKSKEEEEEESFKLLLDLLHLTEIQLPEKFVGESLIASMLYWQYKFQGVDVWQRKDFAQLVGQLRQRLDNEDKDLYKALHKWNETQNATVYVIEPDSVQRINDTSDATKIAIFGLRKSKQICPLVFERHITHPVSTIQFSELVTEHVAETLRHVENSSSKGAKELRVALGPHIKSLTMTESQPRDQGAKIVFFGRQGIGKSFLINKIIKHSLRKKSEIDAAYWHEVSWYWHSFHFKYREIVVDTIDAEDSLENIYHNTTSFVEVPMNNEKLSSYYLLQEGSVSSTTRLNSTISYGVMFSITIEFLSARQVEIELCRVKDYNFIQAAYEDEEVNITFKGLNMIGIERKLVEVTEEELHIDPHFRGKLGTKITFTSPYHSVDESLQYVKAKYMSYCGGDRHFWGLIKSVEFRLPLPILKNGGQLIDCPGLVRQDYILKQQTSAALDVATHVIYVSDHGDINNDFALLESSKFMKRYQQKIKEQFEANSLESMASQCTIVFNNIDVKAKNKGEMLSIMKEHATKMQNRLKEIFWQFIIQTCVKQFPANIKDHAIKLSQKLSKWYFNESMTLTEPLSSLHGAGQLLFQANYQPQGPEIYTSPFALTHLLFNTKKYGIQLSGNEKGVDFFMNSLAQMLFQDQTKNELERAKSFYSKIDSCIQFMSDVSQKLDCTYFQAVAAQLQSKMYKHYPEFQFQLRQWYHYTSAKVTARIAADIEAAKSQCSMAKLEQYIIEQTKVFEHKAPEQRCREFINRICLGKGGFSCYSLSDIVLRPMWKEVDSMLNNIGKLILKEKDHPNVDDFVAIDEIHLLDIINGISAKFFESHNDNDNNNYMDSDNDDDNYTYIDIYNDIYHYNDNNNYVDDNDHHNHNDNNNNNDNDDYSNNDKDSDNNDDNYIYKYTDNNNYIDDNDNDHCNHNDNNNNDNNSDKNNDEGNDVQNKIKQQYIQFEKNKFIVEMKSNIKQFERLSSVVAVEKTNLQVTFDADIKKLIEQKDQYMNRKISRINYRNAYLKEILPQFINSCAAIIKEKILERIDTLLRRIAGLDKGEQGFSLVLKMQDYFKANSKKHNGEIDYQYDFLKLKSYFQAAHISILQCAVQPSLSSCKLQRQILHSYFEMSFINATAIKLSRDKMEWNHFVAKHPKVWSFEEKKFVVNQIKNYGDIPNTSKVSLPQQSIQNVITGLRRAFPLANQGKERGKSGVRQMLTIHFSKSIFGTAALAMNYVNNPFNRSHALQHAFDLFNEPDLEDLIIRHFIQLAIPEKNNAEMKIKDITKQVNDTLDERGYEDVLTEEHVTKFIIAMKGDYKSRQEALKVISDQIAQTSTTKKERKKEKASIPILDSKEEELIEFDSDEIGNSSEIKTKKRKHDAKEKNTKKRHKTK